MLSKMDTSSIIAQPNECPALNVFGIFELARLVLDHLDGKDLLNAETDVGLGPSGHIAAV